MREASPEREAEIENRLWDRQTLRIYCDTSMSSKTRLLSVATVFVFDGETEVYTRVLGAKETNNVKGEIEAAKFALKQIPVFLRKAMLTQKPETIIVYSDYNEINQYVNDTENVKVEYIGDDKKYNPFYTAAHNAARKAIYLRPKSGSLR